MKNFLVTGASGTVGQALITFLIKTHPINHLYLAVRNPEKAHSAQKDLPKTTFRAFDFENDKSWNQAFEQINTLFLLRPPHLSDVEKYFKPLLSCAKHAGIQEIMFLSVQGVEKSSVIPHHKIEKLIIQYGFKYVFLRPSYFMQNLTTTLLNDIQSKRAIALPAANARFNWVDVHDIAEVATVMLSSFEEYKNESYEITGPENASFQDVVNRINHKLNTPIKYIPMNPLWFFVQKRKEGLPTSKIIVLILLHFLPKFQKPPEISHTYHQITGKKPTSINTFIDQNLDLWEMSTASR
jgi:uncharacterized protein YbjT (DUF2867 family)